MVTFYSIDVHIIIIERVTLRKFKKKKSKNFRCSYLNLLLDLVYTCRQNS